MFFVEINIYFCIFNNVLRYNFSVLINTSLSKLYLVLYIFIFYFVSFFLDLAKYVVWLLSVSVCIAALQWE